MESFFKLVAQANKYTHSSTQLHFWFLLCYRNSRDVVWSKYILINNIMLAVNHKWFIHECYSMNNLKLRKIKYFVCKTLEFQSTELPLSVCQAKRILLFVSGNGQGFSPKQAGMRLRMFQALQCQMNCFYSASYWDIRNLFDRVFLGGIHQTINRISHNFTPR